MLFISVGVNIPLAAISTVYKHKYSVTEANIKNTFTTEHSTAA